MNYEKTDCENELFEKLKKMNYLSNVKFEQQVQFTFPKGKEDFEGDRCYVVDILVYHKNVPCLIIEVDGETMHLSKYFEDRERDYNLLFWFGLPTLRVSNCDVKSNIAIYSDVLMLIGRNFNTGMKRYIKKKIKKS